MWAPLVNVNHFRVVPVKCSAGALPEGWEPTLRRCYQILEPFIQEMRKPENGGPQYWVGFDWLFNELDRLGAVERHTRNLRLALRRL